MKRHKELVAALGILMLGLSSYSRTLANQVNDGTIPAHDFGTAWLGALVPAHAQAVSIGRQVFVPDASEPDMDEAEAIVSRETPFVHRFVADIQGGRYGAPGELDIDAIERRANLYTEGLRGTANDALVKTLPPVTVIDWICPEDEHSCEECISLDESGPYTAETLPARPGGTYTQCGRNCRCQLEIDDQHLAF